MNLDDATAGTVRFAPHRAETFKAYNFLPAAAAFVYAAFFIAEGSFSLSNCEIIITAAMFAATPALLLYAEIRRRRTVCELRGKVLKYSSLTQSKKMRLAHIERVEICGTPILRLIGCVRLKIYSDMSRRAWLSVAIPAETAAPVIGTAVSPGPEVGRIMPGRHSVAVYSVTSELTAVLLVFSAYFSLFAGNNAGMNIAALLMLAAAIFDIARSAAGHFRLSFTRNETGCRVETGLFFTKTVYIPECSIIGAVVRRTAAGILCGFGSLCILTSGGNEILVACRVSESELTHSALKLIKAEVRTKTVLSVTDAIKNSFIAGLIISLFAAFIAASLAVQSDDPTLRAISCTAAALMTVNGMRQLMGLRCADGLELTVTPSVICSGGMSPCGTGQFFISRGCISGVRVHSDIFQRMNGMCSAAPFAAGGTRGGNCRFVSYGALNGFISRFSG